MSALWATLSLLAILAAGNAVASAVCDERDLRRGLACVLGPVTIAFALFVASLAGLPLTTPVCRATCGVAIAAGLWSSWRAHVASRARQDARSSADGLVYAIVPLACVALGVTFLALSPPANDAFSNWGLKALVLARDGTVRSPDLFEDGRFLFHPNYPLSVPLAQAFVHACVGETAEGPARGVFVLAQIGTGLVLFGALRTRVAPRVAAAAAAILVATPSFWRSGVDLRFPGSIPAGYADPMFTALVAATVATALAWAHRPTARSATAIGVCVGFALFTKNEGQPFAVAILGAAGLAFVVERLRRRATASPRTLAIAALVAGCIAAPWFAFRTELPARDENYQQQISRERVAEHAWRTPVIATAAVGEALAVDRHGLTWIALSLAVVLRFRRTTRAPIPFLLAALGAMAFVYALVFVVTPLPIVDSLATSIPRTFFHVTPLAVAALALLCDRREADP